MRNVSRAWAYETGLAAGVELGPGEISNEMSLRFSGLLADLQTRNPRQ